MRTAIALVCVTTGLFFSACAADKPKPETRNDEPAPGEEHGPATFWGLTLVAENLDDVAIPSDDDGRNQQRQP